MGAHDFTTRAKGMTAREAYANARAEASAENGHQDGYSGDIQTTSGFVMVATNGKTVQETVEAILEDDANPYEIEKWGKAGCIALGGGVYLFFGWAAS